MSQLRIDNMSHSFGGLKAVSQLNISVEPGRMEGLIGPNGAGKTTVFNLVSGFYHPTEGQILIDGQPTMGKKPHQITAMGVARTFQNIRLWKDMTVLDNIRIAQHHRLGYGFFDSVFRTKRYMTRERAIEHNAHQLLDALKLSEHAQEFPVNLPYGTQRKVEIARALSVQPKLLLLDEPAAGLNSNDMVELIELIRWIHKEFPVSIWMIEHHMDVVMALCSHIVCIDFGETIAEGTPEEIQNNPAVITAYLGDDEI
jgi:branched-chain amino acid transport system ATP-binding protein